MVDRGVAESGRHAAGSPGALREDVVIRRTSAGWRVEGAFPSLPTDTVDELGHALALADLLTEDAVPRPRPPRPADGLDEVDRLRAAVRQLEHALASRVVVEQAIGVLTERWRVAPRDAFEQLRRITRSRGLRIHDLARQVIDSCTDPDVALPAELVPAPRAGGPPEPRQSPDRRERPREPRRGRRERERGRGSRAEPGEPAVRNGQPRPLPPGVARPGPVPAGHVAGGAAGGPSPATHGRHARLEQ